MKKIMLLFTTCMLCVACQQHNNIEQSQLEGLWEVRRMSGGYSARHGTFYRFKPDGYNIISFSYAEGSLMGGGSHPYELYDNQLRLWWYENYEGKEIFHYDVLYNCKMQGDSILYLTPKECDISNSFREATPFPDEDWTPDANVKLIRVSDEYLRFLLRDFHFSEEEYQFYTS